MEWKGRRVCITGASGFIGRHLLARLIEEGARPSLLLRYTSRPDHELLPAETLANCRVTRGDIADPAALRRAMDDCDTIFHLAALIGIPYSYESPEEVVRVNVTGTQNVLERAREAGTPRVVITSTSEVYGSAQAVPMPLDHPLNAQSPYAASKIAADQLGLSYHRSFGLPVSILRPFNTYGSGQSSRAVIPVILSQALRGQKIQLGNLDSTRDFTWAGDTARAFLLAASRKEMIGRVCTCGTGVETSIGQLVELAGKLTGRTLQIDQQQDRMRPEQSEVDRLCCDPAPAAELLGWQAEVSIEEGLERTLTWMKDNLDEIGHGYQR
jgi:nucleoside-diphosphate-sugar epimerase